MALPNPGMDAVPFTPLTAEFLDDMIENIESLSDGTGFETGAITTNTLAESAVTANKIDLSTFPQSAFGTFSGAAGTTSGSYTGSSALNPSAVTIQATGGTRKVRVTISSLQYGSSAGTDAYLSVDVTGANVIAPSDLRCIQKTGTAGHRASFTYVTTLPNAGATTFTPVIRASGGGACTVDGVQISVEQLVN